MRLSSAALSSSLSAVASAKPAARSLRSSFPRVPLAAPRPLVVRAELASPSSSSKGNSFGTTRPSIARKGALRSSSSSRAAAPLLVVRASSAGAADADALLGGGGGGGNSGIGGGGGSAKPRPTDEAGDDDDEEEEGETYLDAAAAAAAAASKGITLPADFLAAASSSPGGLRASALAAYAALFGGGGGKTALSPIARALAAAFPFVRDRLLRDPRYLFKVGAEVAIDAGCATVAEVRKRGDDFWGEFEFYLSDLVVGCVLDVVLVTLMAPAMPIGRKAAAVSAASSSSLVAKIVAPIRKAAAGVPSAVLEASVPGARPYSLSQRVGCLFVKFGEYSLAGMGCGLVGQSAANGLMAAKRKFSESRAAASAAAAKDGKGGKSKKQQQQQQPAVVHLTPPPVGMTALTWGLFMGVSSNVRYQIVYGLERAVDMTVAKKLPAAAYVATLAFRFANNVIGGENFIDMARWTGIQ